MFLFWGLTTQRWSALPIGSLIWRQWQNSWKQNCDEYMIIVGCNRGSFHLHNLLSKTETTLPFALNQMHADDYFGFTICQINPCKLGFESNLLSGCGRGGMSERGGLNVPALTHCLTPVAPFDQEHHSVWILLDIFISALQWVTCISFTSSSVDVSDTPRLRHSSFWSSTTKTPPHDLNHVLVVFPNT